MWFLISAAELECYLDECQDIYLVDLRDRISYEESHIRGAVNIPYEELQQRMPELPLQRLIILYCYHGPNSMLAARMLAGCGYQAADVVGGICAYRGKYRT